jgi:hypothetical protein
MKAVESDQGNRTKDMLNVKSGPPFNPIKKPNPTAPTTKKNKK